MTSDLHLPPELAAGGVLWRRKNEDVQVLLVHRPSYDDWSLPKGKLDSGESLLQCAIREVEEETGYTCRVGRKLPTVTYRKANGDPKEVAFWAMEPISGKFTPNKEVDRAKWVRFDKAIKRLSYDVDRQMLQSLGAKWREHPRRVLLVRHALAGDRHRWTGPEDAKRPLSTRGERQAKELLDILHPFPIDRVLSSPATRCIDTVQQLARQRHHRVMVVDALWEDAPLEPAIELVAGAKRGVTVMSSHGPIIGGILRAMLDTRRPFPYEKGSVWVLDVRRNKLTDANYLAPNS